MQKCFVDGVQNESNSNMAVINAVLLFFSELNSVFLFQTLAPSLGRLLSQAQSSPRVQALWSLTGIKVVLLAMSYEDFAFSDSRIGI